MARLWVTDQAVDIRYVEQGVQQATVAHIDLGGLHQTLAYIGKMRLQPAQHHGVAERIEVTRDGGVRDPSQRCRNVRCIEQCAVQMRRHAPEAMQGLGRHVDPEFADIAIQKGRNEIRAPAERKRIAWGQVADGKAAPQPQLLQRLQVRRGVGARPGNSGLHHFTHQQRRQFQVACAPGQ